MQNRYVAYFKSSTVLPNNLLCLLNVSLMTANAQLYHTNTTNPTNIISLQNERAQLYVVSVTLLGGQKYLSNIGSITSLTLSYGYYKFNPIIIYLNSKIRNYDLNDSNIQFSNYLFPH